MIVVLLALAEQVIAIVAGCAPVVSAVVVRLLVRRKHNNKPDVNLPRTLTQRFRPGREGAKRAKASDPYPTTGAATGAQGSASEEALDPGFAGREEAEGARGDEGWELGAVASVSAKGGGAGVRNA